MGRSPRRFRDMGRNKSINVRSIGLAPSWNLGRGSNGCVGVSVGTGVGSGVESVVFTPQDPEGAEQRHCDTRDVPRTSIIFNAGSHTSFSLRYYTYSEKCWKAVTKITTRTVWTNFSPFPRRLPRWLPRDRSNLP